MIIEDSVPERKSKSQRKREMIALQEIGEKLVHLPMAHLSKIPLPDTLLDAVTAARALTNHGAKRRQLQYIGRLMREIEAEDVALIQNTLNALQNKQHVKTRHIDS